MTTMSSLHIAIPGVTQPARDLGLMDDPTSVVVRAVELDLSGAPLAHRPRLLTWQQELRERGWRAWTRLFWLDEAYCDEFLEDDAKAFILIATVLIDGPRR